MVTPMASRRFALAESGDELFESAPVVYRIVTDAPVPPEKMWAALTADDAMISWSPAVSGLRWLSPRPFGVGTERELTLLRGLVTVKERYYRWDEGKRKSFNVVEATVPGLRRMAEDYVVEATPTGSRLTWIIAIDPVSPLTPFMRLTGPAGSLPFRQMARGMVARLRA
jgi:hypothetical protein